MISKEIVLKAKQDGQVLFFKKEFDKTPGWDRFYTLYQEAMSRKKEEYGFCTTLVIDNSETMIPDFDYFIDYFEGVHPGKKIAVLAINHFLSSNDNVVPEEAVDFEKAFKENNPNKLPNDFDLNLLQPTRHSDPVDGFFVQCNGKTRWRVFYENHTDVFDAEPGDALYIPSGIEHSVETMTVRSSISISFYDN